jgi:perosamine synthetase
MGLDGKTDETGGSESMRQKRNIPVAAPMLVGNEKAYVIDCLDSTWISSTGKYVERFESAFADFCGVRHAISCCNGTVALHLALVALGLKAGDEVIVPTLTFVATANVVRYCGATPIFVDVDPATWTMDPVLVEQKITSRTRGIIVVHLYGQPTDLDPVLDVARRHSLFVVEDAAEAHGAEYKGKKVGSLTAVGAFSFYGNKALTTGEGGMLTTNDDDFAAKLRLLRGQGMDSQRRYWHPVIGYNYRMTNVAAAIGSGQLERADWHLECRANVANWYKKALAGIAGITWQSEPDWSRRIYWMFSIVLDGEAGNRDAAMAHLQADGIETRPLFYPLHLLPPYQQANNAGYPVAEQISRNGFSLPTWAGLSSDDVNYVAESLVQYLQLSGRE